MCTYIINIHSCTCILKVHDQKKAKAILYYIIILMETRVVSLTHTVVLTWTLNGGTIKIEGYYYIYHLHVKVCVCVGGVGP